ncbi:MAG TPA: nuclear transport factor 2 family protein [Acidobacteriaceae bacterium]|jgi:ketosteroid isomerase-like protein|nr:nuclear transport factor 2 family protein [Acidobacteriaceae bacterium]
MMLRKSAALRFPVRLAASLAAACALLLFPALRAQNIAATGPILQVLADQQNNWNRGDIVDFMHGYADSPETTFIGTTIARGYAPILARYQKKYSSADAMGHLEFSDVHVRLLGAEHAVVTGSFHLARTAAGGGDASGIFSLVFEKEEAGWKIILDHTTTS